MRDICLKVLSWNLHAMAWPLSKDPGGRMDRVSAKMRELSPDVALFQEVWFGSLVDRLTLALQPDWIPICIKRRSAGPRGGLLAFVSACAGWRVRAAPEFHAFAASAPAWKVWEGDGLGGKGILTVELERGEQRICAVNTHLQSAYPGIDYADVREAQLNELREMVSRFHASLPAIVAGDFNTDSRESLYSLIAALGTDLTAEARERGSLGTYADSHDQRPEWIDYIVAANSHAWTASASLELIANQRADVPYSDHSGLFCTLTLARRQ
ncbi:endonuclease/exonuclease/phosphatase family protein [Candidatus Binatus sp.]|uniref:endonuclease/exonuclease/phosphatase family protein n=1 Tax=Candidatus Binatus sp. TaxID=2811406 RepID=UPI002F935A0D